MNRISPWALGVATGVSALLLVLAGEYGFRRDELYFIIAGRRVPPEWAVRWPMFRHLD